MHSYAPEYDTLRAAVERLALHLAPFQGQDSPDTIGEPGADYLERVALDVAREAESAAWAAINVAPRDDREIHELFDVAIVAVDVIATSAADTNCILLRSLRSLLSRHVERSLGRPLAPVEEAVHA